MYRLSPPLLDGHFLFYTIIRLINLTILFFIHINAHEIRMKNNTKSIGVAIVLRIVQIFNRHTNYRDKKFLK